MPLPENKWHTLEEVALRWHRWGYGERSEMLDRLRRYAINDQIVLSCTTEDGQQLAYLSADDAFRVIKYQGAEIRRAFADKERTRKIESQREQARKAGEMSAAHHASRWDCHTGHLLVAFDELQRFEHEHQLGPIDHQPDQPEPNIPDSHLKLIALLVYRLIQHGHLKADSATKMGKALAVDIRKLDKALGGKVSLDRCGEVAIKNILLEVQRVTEVKFQGD